MRPAAEIVRLGFAVALPFGAVRFAHRAFCARLIFFRAAADIVRAPVDLDPLYSCLLYTSYLSALLLQMTGGVCERRPLEDDCTVVEVNYIGEGAFG